MYTSSYQHMYVHLKFKFVVRQELLEQWYHTYPIVVNLCEKVIGRKEALHVTHMPLSLKINSAYTETSEHCHIEDFGPLLGLQTLEAFVYFYYDFI